MLLYSTKIRSLDNYIFILTALIVPATKMQGFATFLYEIKCLHFVL